MTKLYDLPQKFVVYDERDAKGVTTGYTLHCNGRFVYWADNLNKIFIAFGRMLLKKRTRT